MIWFTRSKKAARTSGGRFSQGQRRTKEIAVVGMACRLPKARNYDEFWENLIGGKSAVTEIPGDRWDWRAYWGDPKTGENKTNSKWGGFIDGVDTFDAELFGISPREAELMDPQQRIILELAWACLEDAGIAASSLSGRKIGVNIGVFNFDYKELLEKGRSSVAAHHSTGTAAAIIPNRVSYFFNFKGPSIPVDTACSSSLFAIHQAIRSIQENECEMALAGGISLLLTPTRYISFAKTGMLSPTGSCKTFDESADGYVRGEGAGIILLKPLDKAIADNDSIYGLIKGSAINHGGKVYTLTYPNPETQSDVIFEAYSQAGIDASTISYIEAHGTGTPKGDPIEFSGLVKAFDKLTGDSGRPVMKGYCGLGSAKASIGHLESAAGIAGVIKVLLSMKHGRLPGLPNFEKLNSGICLDDRPFYIVKEAQQWQRLKDRKGNEIPRRAGVSSFGFGGTNAHVVIEEYLGQRPEVSPPRLRRDSHKPHLIVFSAKNETRLKELVTNFVEYLQRNPRLGSDTLTDIAYTLQTGREALEERLALVANNRDELIEKLHRLGQGQAQIEGCYRGNIRQNSDASRLITSNQATKQVIAQWLKDTSLSGSHVEDIARLWVQGMEIDWRLLYGEQKPERLRLPTYPFARERFWIPEEAGSALPTDARQSKSSYHLHPLLHQNVSDLHEQRFSSLFDVHDAFLKDCRLYGQPLLSAAAHIEMARVAGTLSSRQQVIQIIDLVWETPLRVDRETAEVSVSLRPEADHVAYQIGELIAGSDQPGAVSSYGKLLLGAFDERQHPEPLEIETINRRCSNRMTGQSCYMLLSGQGLDYGSELQTIEALHYNENEAIARFCRTNSEESDEAHCLLTIGILDAAFQTAMAWFLRNENSADALLSRARMPWATEIVTLYGKLPERGYAYVRHSASTPQKGQGAKYDVDICDQQGAIAVTLKGVTYRCIEPQVYEPTTVTPLVEAPKELLFYQERWEEREIETAAFSTGSGSGPHLVVCFGIDETEAGALGSYLKGQDPNNAVVRVEKGNSFSQLSEACFAMQWLEEEAYERLLQSLPIAGIQQLSVIYRWADGQGLSGLQGIYTLLKAVKSQRQAPRTLIITGCVSDDLQSAYALSWIGYRQSLSFVMPELQVVLVYHDKEVPRIESVWDERLSAAVVRYEKQRRYELDFAPAALLPGELPLVRKGVYLITGGCGGLGGVVAAHLAEKYHAALVLIGRRERNAEIESAINQLKAKGATAVDYMSADVADIDAMTLRIGEVKQRYDRLNGIIHAAGVESITPFHEKNWSELLKVMAPKIDGTVVLDRVTAHLDLDFMCYFSSSSAILGDFGACDYALGNRFQMSYGAYRQGLVQKGERHGKTCVVCWPLWRDGGIRVGESQQTEMYLKSSGQRYLEKDEGLAAWERLLATDVPHLVLVSQAARAEAFLNRAYRRKEKANTTIAESADRWIGNEKGDSTVLDAGSSPRGVSLTGCVKQDVERLILGILKIKTKDRLDETANFVDFGLDSIGLTDLTAGLSEYYHLDITPSILFSYNTIEKLGGYLADRYKNELSGFYQKSIPEKRLNTADAPAPISAVKPMNRMSESRFMKKRDRIDQEPVAVIGMAGRFPGADNIEELWQTLHSARSTVQEIPGIRWNWKDYYSAPGDRGNQITTNKGGFISGADEFDSLFFEISPREAELMDPRQRLLLEEAWHAFEDAGYGGKQIHGKSCGVFIGVEEGEYGRLTQGNENALMTGSHNGILAARISYFLDLKGPNLAINTACSSGLVAVHYACQALQRGDCEMALAGAVNLLLTPEIYKDLSNMGMLSESGACFTFDKRADGMVPGEAVAAIVLKPLSKAIRDRDLIYGIIKASGINYDGKTNGITAPSGLAQKALIKEIYDKNNINAGDIDYMIAHGTGTKLGDPVEINAVSEVFSDYTNKTGYCALGSVKTNLGHTFAASGVVSLISALMSMRHKAIPATLNFAELNPFIKLDSSPFYINKTTKAWDKQPGTRRMGTVSAFGMSGTNAHVVLEEWPDHEHAADDLLPTRMQDQPTLIVLSAKNEERLQALVARIRHYLADIEPFAQTDLKSVAYTLQVGRLAMDHRIAFLAKDRADLLEKMDAVTEQGSAIAGCYRGVARKEKKNPTTLFNSEEEIEAVVHRWLVEDKLDELAELWVKGFEFDWDLLYREWKPRRVRLPTYPFAKERHWVEQPLRPVIESPMDPVLHPLLHRNTSTLGQQQFTSTFTGKEFYLKDHQVNDKSVLPGVAYLEMARAAGEFAVTGRQVTQIKDVIWLLPIHVDNAPADVRINLSPQRNDEIAFTVSARAEGDSLDVNAKGTLVCKSAALPDTSAALDLSAIESRCSERLSQAACYETFRQQGLNYGPGFRAVEEVLYRHDKTEALVRLQLPAVVAADQRQFRLHPSLLDGALQGMVSLLDSEEAVKDSPYLPFSLTLLELLQPVPARAYAYIKLLEVQPNIARFNIAVLDERGGICLKLHELAFKTAPEKEKGFYYYPYWQEETLPRATVAGLAQSGDIVIVAPEMLREFSQAIAARHPAQRVHYWWWGEETRPLDERSWTVNSVGLSQPVAAIGELHSLYFLGGCSPHHDPVTAETVIAGQQSGVLALFSLVKALDEHGWMQRSFALKIITEKTHAVRPGEALDPRHAGLSGMTMSLSKEYPAVDITCIDILRSADSQYIDSADMDILLKETGSAGHPVCIRNGTRYFRRLLPLRPSAEEVFPCRTDGVYLILGGTGGIGLETAVYLAERVGARLVLVGRSTLTESKKRQLRRILDAGGDYLYCQADGTDPVQMQNVVRQAKSRFGAVNGAIQSALVLKDGAFCTLDESAFRAALDAKVQASVVLYEAVKDEPLDFLVFFSSCLSLSGNAGQSNYTAGCAFKDAYAHYLNRVCRFPVKVINWGYWGEVGVAASEQYRERFARKGIFSISVAQGMDAFTQALSGPATQVAAMKAAPSFLREMAVDFTRAVSVIGGELKIAPAQRISLPVEKKHSDDREAPATSLETSLAASAYEEVEAQRITAAITTAPHQAEVNAAFVERSVTEVVSKNLNISATAFDSDVPFSEYGVDSILAVRIINQLNDKLGISLRTTDLFNYTTIEQISAHIAAILAEAGGSSRPDGSSVADVAVVDPHILFERNAERQLKSADAPFDESVVASIEAAKIKPSETRHGVGLDIAVIGIAGRFPGAGDMETFWNNLASGKDSVTDVSGVRWDGSDFYDADPDAPGKSYSRWAGLLDEIDQFDPAFFNISPREAQLMDPQQRLFLMESWKALEDAGYATSDLSGKKCGVFVGCSEGDYSQQLTDAHITEAYRFTGNSNSILAARISYYLNLKGPSIAIDTACSSSLVAIHLACESIRFGTSSLAIAGGVCVLTTPKFHVLSSRARMLSAGGKCKAFNQNADGFVPAEGVGVLILKSLDQAIADGDHIYGVITGSGINQDGKTSGITAPNGPSQTALERNVYDRYRISPETIGYVEAHGTGTKLGDPIEVNALTEAFRCYTDRKAYCAIGSVKTNIGHALTAAGVAGVLKILMAFKHKALPPVLHFEKPNELIDFQSSPFYVNTQLKPWQVEAGVSRRAAVSSFGFSGTNAHMVLEEYVEEQVAMDGDTASGLQPQLVILSAKSEKQLTHYAGRLKDHLSNRLPLAAADLAGIAYTLQTGREPMQYRAAFVVRDGDELVEKLDQFQNGNTTVQGCWFGQAKEGTTRLVGADGDINEAISKWLKEGEVTELAERWVAGAKVNWDSLYKNARPKRVSLPTYPFSTKRYWFDSRSPGFGHPQASVSTTPDEASVPDEKEKSVSTENPDCGTGPAPGDHAGAPKVALTDLQSFAPKHAETAARNEFRTIQLTGLSVVSPYKGNHSAVGLSCKPDADKYPVKKVSLFNLQKDSKPMQAEGKNQPADFEQVQVRLRELLANVLYLETDEVEVDEKFSDLGLDSITGVEWTKQISRAFGIKVEVTTIYDHPTIVSLTEHLAERLPHEPAPAAAEKSFESAGSRETDSASRSADCAPGVYADVQQQLRKLLANVLYLETDEVDVDEKFSDLGLDSITGVEWTKQISRAFGIKVEVTTIYDHPTIGELAKHVAACQTLRPESTAGVETVRNSHKSAPADTPLSKNLVADAVTVGMTEHIGPASDRSPVVDAYKRKDERITGQGIAIIGISGRFAKAADLDELWNNIAGGVDAITEVPEDRWNIKDYFDTNPLAPRKTNSKWLGAVADIDKFDAAFFNISPREAELMDPQQRLFLEEAWKAIEDAGYDPERLSSSRCGIFVGVGQGDYSSKLRTSNIAPDAYTLLGMNNSILTARLSYILNLKGASMAIDTACSSSLVAIHEGCQSLLNGQNEMVLAGGVYVSTTPEMHIMSSKSNMLSADGRCKTFDDKADGFVIGEGVGVIVLKRLSDAVRDGDHIYGVIKGSGVNQDGATNGITAPSLSSQKQLEMDVYRNAGVNPEHIQLVEAHGTGTILGDPIEVGALTAAFREFTPKRGYCAIGSVKTQIGHTLAAAGVASVLKVLLALKHRKLPPSLHFDKPNQHIDFDSSPFYVNTQLREWHAPAGAIRSAAVSSFGFSGTNAHLVIEQYDADCDRVSDNKGQDRPRLIVLSARSKERLKAYAHRLAAYLTDAVKDVPDELRDIAYTLQTGRGAMAHRLAVIVTDHEELANKLSLFQQDASEIENCFYGTVDKDSSAINRLAGKDRVNQAIEGQTDEAYLRVLAQFWIKGGNLDWDTLYRNEKPRRISLPTYPFVKERYWIPEAAVLEVPLSGERLHPLLHRNISDLEEQKFDSRFTRRDVFIKDCRLEGENIFPASACMEMARVATELASKKPVTGMRHFVWTRPLRFSGDAADVSVSLSPENGSILCRVSVSSRTSGDEPLVLTQGELLSAEEEGAGPAERLDIAAIERRCTSVLDGAVHREMLAKQGIDYGPAFHALETLRYNDREALARLRLPDTFEGDDRFLLHPSLLEGALQAAQWLHGMAQEANPHFPARIRSVALHAALPAHGFASARLASGRADPQRRYDVDITDQDGNVIVAIRGLEWQHIANTESESAFEDAVGGLAAIEEVEADLLTYREFWQESPRTDRAVASSARGAGKRRVMYFGAADEAAALRSLFRQENEETGVVPVKKGNAFDKQADGSFTLRWNEEDDFRRLFEDLKAQGETQTAVIYRWAEKQGLEGIKGIYILLKTAQLTGLNIDGLIITGVTTEGLESCYDMSWLGFKQTLRLVMPRIRTTLIYHDWTEPDVGAIWNERSSRETTVRYQNGKRYVLSSRRQAVAAGNGAVPVKHGVYIITGGRGGLGNLFAAYLAERYQAYLVLIGRRPADADSDAKIRELKERGAAEAVYFAGDVSDLPRMKEVIGAVEQRFGHVNGVIHAAGVLSGKMLSEKDWSEFLSTLKPKIDGTIVLDRVTSHLSLDFVCYFSSSSAMLGDFGGCDYATGNRFQLAYGAYRERLRLTGERSGKTCVINWPLWREGGLNVGDTEKSRMYLASSGQRFLEREEGLAIWKELLASDETQHLVLAGNRARIQRFLDRAYDLGSVALGEDMTPGRNEHSDLTDLELDACVKRSLRDQITKVLKLSAQRLDEDTNFSDFGFDSITLTELSRNLSDIYQFEIAPAVFFSFSTIEKLSGHLASRHRGALKQYYQSARQHRISEQHRKTSVIASPVPVTSRAKQRFLSPASSAAEEPIAIIGISGKFPGADNIDELWEILSGGRCAISEIPSDRWDWRNYYVAPGAASNQITTNKGGFVNSVREFDPLFFEISPREAELMDPRQRLLLQAAWHAFEDAGYSARHLQEKSCGVFIGVEDSEYAHLIRGRENSLATATHNGILAARISYFLNLKGPNLAINTACSSGLVALHYACQSIQRGDCELALAGGVNLLLTPLIYKELSKMGMLAKSGACYTFDERADGMVPGEAIAVLVLKPLSKAMRDGDVIHGVIKGSGVNYDGKTNGITAPSGISQTALIKNIYEKHRIDASEIDYLMTHGTGTKLGDPVEVGALADVFADGTTGPSRCALGSVKTNLGHTFAASGIVSLISVLMAMRHKKIPAVANYDQVNPYIRLEGSPFYVNKKTISWPKTDGKKRLAAVSAFGMSGTNAHVVVEEYANEAVETTGFVTGGSPQLFILSAKTREQLRTSVHNLKKYLIDRPHLTSAQLSEISYTLQVGREPMEERAAFIAGDQDELISKLERFGLHEEAADWYQGKASPDNDAIRLFTADDELKEALAKWIERGKLSKLAELWVKGLELDWELLYGRVKPRRVSLPVYPFARESYWVPTSDSALLPTATGEAFQNLHPLLHRNTSTLDAQRFSSVFDGEEVFFREHRVGGVKTLPGVAYLEMARAAAARSTDAAVSALEEVVWRAPLVVTAAPCRVTLELHPEGAQRIAYEIRTEATDSGDRVVHGQGRLVVGPVATPPPPLALDAIQQRCPGEIDGDSCYRQLAAQGLEYGAGFRGLARVSYGPGEALAELRLPDSADGSLDEGLPLGLLDAALQGTLGLALAEAGPRAQGPMLPFSVRRVRLYGPLRSPAYAHIRYSRGHGADAKVVQYDIAISDATGRIAVALEQFTALAAPMAEARPRGVVYARPRWLDQAGAAAAPAGPAPRLIVADAAQAEALQGAFGDAEVLVLAAEGGLAEQARTAFLHLFDRLQPVLKEKGAALRPVLVLSRRSDRLRVAALAGLLKTAHLENPAVCGKLVEYPDTVAPAQLLDWVSREIASPAAGIERIRYGEDGRREVRVLEPVSLPAAGGGPIKAGGVYWITGGLGGLGLLFARHLGRQPGVKLILSGRSAQEAATGPLLAQLGEAGLAAEYWPCDVGARDEVERLVKTIVQRHGRLDGILHSAGVTQDAFLRNKTPAQIEAVLRAKVAGLVNLDEATADQALDFLVLFSSLSGELGNVGQGDYAGANAFMDAYAEYRQDLVAAGRRRGKTVSLNWPLWQAGGMRVDAASERWLEQRLGLVPLAEAEGLAAFDRALAGEDPQLLVLSGQEAKIKTLLAAGAERPEPPPVSEAAPSLPAADAAGLDNGAIAYLKRFLSTALKIDLHRIEADAPLEKYGIDSLLIMTLTDQLEKAFGPLSKTLFFEYQTLAELAHYFVQNHRARLTDLLGEPQTGTAPTLAPPAMPIAAVPETGRKRGRFFSPPEKEGAASGRDNAIAIIGLSGKYPRAANLEIFWDNLKSGRDCIEEIPEGRWDHSLYYDADKDRPGKTYGKWGGFLDDVDKFDPLFFNISPREAEFMDPQERLFLETVWETLEDAGYTRESLHRSTARAGRLAGNVGVYVGVMYEEYQLFGAEQSLKGNVMALSGNPASIANRVSYFCNLHGPSLALDTMCSSSLTAIHLACEAIRNGSCEMAIAGGVNVSIHPNKYLALSQGKFISSKGRCESFGEGGDGYIPGEGVGAVLLKPLKQAIEDGDHIYGVIKGTALNHGGKTNGYTVPNPRAQTDVIKRAIEQAGVEPRAISYIEAHGTGTRLGDPIEITGLSQAFESYTTDRQFCAIGSAKSNIGHCESAAGIAGLSKVLLQMKHATLVPSLHSEVLNPHIDFAQTPFVVQHRCEPWQRPVLVSESEAKEYPRLAGVSSFGAGGSNAHVIVEEYRPDGEASFPAEAVEPGAPVLIPLSARNAERLQVYAEKLLAFLKRMSATVESQSQNWPVTEIESAISHIVADVTGVDHSEFDSTAGFSDFGIDAIQINQIIDHIQNSLTVDITSHVITECQSIRGLSEYIVSHHRAEAEKYSSKKGEAINASSQNTPVENRSENISLRDLSYTLQIGREAMKHRIAFVVSDLDDLVTKLESFVAGRADIPCFYHGIANKREEANQASTFGEAAKELTRRINAKELEKLAQAWINGTDVRWEELHTNYRPRRISLPTYPFVKQRCWIPEAERAPKDERAAIEGNHDPVDQQGGEFDESLYHRILDQVMSDALSVEDAAEELKAYVFD
ncbi:SDR family NAD(P)-dependent oxidoreductase [Methylocaldum gracile subsp. desertum]|uniref:SDR family NAD(P)-dependent oxidoreductase n=1 Tax=Methylocaldum sp. GT1BW TaxID=3438964 RepID=UPI003DA047E0